MPTLPVSLLLLLSCLPLAAHVGSPDEFFEGQAGPYRLLVTIRPPEVVPGVAEVEVRSATPGLAQLRMAPLLVSGPGAKYPPTPDVARRSAQDPDLFSGALWLMRTGAWQVRLEAHGPAGQGVLLVPVPAAARRTLEMQRGLGAVLLVLLGLLAAGAVAIAGAAVREGNLPPDQPAGVSALRRGRRAMLAMAVVMAAILYLGNQWWTVEANGFGRSIYKPLEMAASVAGGDRLQLNLSDPGWLPRYRKMDDFLPDHDHLMHLYLFRMPQMDRVYHLHPDMAQSGRFTQALPPLEAGRYSVYGDVVHATGFPETLVATWNTAAQPGQALTGDDAGGALPPLGSAEPRSGVARLSDGSRMVLQSGAPAWPVKRLSLFAFKVESADGRPADDLEFYMGMQGHAAFVKSDGSTFAHVHPSGSVPMATLALAAKEQGIAPDPHAGHLMPGSKLPSVVTFPYGLPRAGQFRIIVQVKKSGRVETAAFDITAR